MEYPKTICCLLFFSLWYILKIFSLLILTQVSNNDCIDVLLDIYLPNAYLKI